MLPSDRCAFEGHRLDLALLVQRRTLYSYAIMQYLTLVLLAMLAGQGSAGISTGPVCSKLKSTVCDSLPVPSGYRMVYCDDDSRKLCGIRLNTALETLCSPKDEQRLIEAQRMCNCYGITRRALQRAPALAQSGTDSCINFNRVSLDVLSVASEAGSCWPSLSGTDLNKQQLIDNLNLKQGVKTIGNVRTYKVSYMPALTTQQYLDVMTQLSSCLGAALAEYAPDSSTTDMITSISPACQPFVDWYAAYAGEALQAALQDSFLVKRLLLEYMQQFAAGLTDVTNALSSMASGNSYSQFLANASATAAELSCPDPHTCNGGLLDDAWTQLQHEVPTSIVAILPTLKKVAQAAGYANSLTGMLQLRLCEEHRQLMDPQHHSLAIYRALVVTLKQESISDQDKLLQSGPRVLPTLALYYAGWPNLQNLDYPMAQLREQVLTVSAEVQKAVDVYQSRMQQALSIISSTQAMTLSFIPGRPSITCPDAKPRLPCPEDACSNPATPTCADGRSCITDGCAQCSAVCTVVPTSATAANQGLRILLSWSQRLRSDKTLTSAAQVVKAHMPKLTSSMDYIYSQQTSPGDRIYMYKHGVLAYNRQVTLDIEFPCFQGSRNQCFRYQGFRECMSVPKVALCKETQTVRLPNEHIPWVGMHGGLAAGIHKVFSIIGAEFTGKNHTAGCA